MKRQLDIFHAAMIRKPTLWCMVVAVLVAAAAMPAAHAQRTGSDNAVPKVADASLGDTRNVHQCGQLFLAGQPTPADIARLKEAGIERVISLRRPEEVQWDEGGMLRKAGIEFISIPIAGPDSMTDEVFGKVRKLLREAEKHPTLLHCGSANRVGAVWLTFRVLDQGVPEEQAIAEAREVGLRTEAYLEKALDYIKRHEDEKRVKPGINANFLDPNLDVSQWIARFEIESREVYAHRQDVIAAMDIKPGDRVADIGAGTGFYSRLFAHAVGDEGWVYAVDISPKFAAHIAEQAEEEGIDNLTVVLGQQRSITLPPDSVDFIFVCDTYHHFEFPLATLKSMRRALRPGGTLIVIDFERIPGKSSDWVMGHVRAGKADFRREIEQAGFQFVKEEKITGFQENYMLRFRDPD